MECVDRRQVVAYRAEAQQLHGAGYGQRRLADLAVLDLGVQDTPPGSAAHALANRAGHVSSDTEMAQAGLTTTWTVRGAPHLHRAGDLPALARALWPWSDEDALARLDTSASPVRRSGLAPRQALRLVAEQIADIVRTPMPKGDVSTALTPRVPAAMTVDCRVCRARHIVETLFRSAVLPAGMTFAPRQRRVTFVRVPDWPGVPSDTAGDDQLMHAFLRLLGPAGPQEVAAFLGTRPAEVQSRWPAGLAEVDVDGQRRWLPEERLPVLLSARKPAGVRLLAPSDPWLQARDRELVVPDARLRKVLWPVLGRPGAVLVDGEVAGSWSARKRGRRLEVTVQPGGATLPAGVRRGVEQQGELAAKVRGASDVAVVFEDH